MQRVDSDCHYRFVKALSFRRLASVFTRKLTVYRHERGNSQVALHDGPHFAELRNDYLGIGIQKLIDVPSQSLRLLQIVLYGSKLASYIDG